MKTDPLLRKQTYGTQINRGFKNSLNKGITFKYDFDKIGNEY